MRFWVLPTTVFDLKVFQDLTDNYIRELVPLGTRFSWFKISLSQLTGSWGLYQENRLVVYFVTCWTRARHSKKLYSIHSGIHTQYVASGSFVYLQSKYFASFSATLMTSRGRERFNYEVSNSSTVGLVHHAITTLPQYKTITSDLSSNQ